MRLGRPPWQTLGPNMLERVSTGPRRRVRWANHPVEPDDSGKFARILDLGRPDAPSMLRDVAFTIIRCRIALLPRQPRRKVGNDNRIRVERCERLAVRGS